MHGAPHSSAHQTEGAQLGCLLKQTRPSSLAQERLSPDLTRQGDFFIANILDVAPKDDLVSMEHPLFALKAGDRRVRIYERNGATVRVMPGTYGCATIHDKDVWIYCISQLMAAMDLGRKDVGPVVCTSQGHG